MAAATLTVEELDRTLDSMIERTEGMLEEVRSLIDALGDGDEEAA